MNGFKGRHFTGEVVLWAVRWYCRYRISYRGLETMMAERGVSVDHSTIYRWVQKYPPEMDKAGCYTQAIRELKEEGKCAKDLERRQVKYLNNVIKADHGKLKQLIRPVRGFKTMRTAYATINGFEVMRALRKGQGRMFNLTGDPIDEKRMIERAFGVGPCVMAEAVTIIEESLAVA